jgi:hypothetical protein
MGWSQFRKTGLTHRDHRTVGGYTLVTPIGSGFTYLIDEAGRIVHSWSAKDFMPGYGYLLPGGTLLVRGQQKVAEHTVGAGQAAGTTDILLEINKDNQVIWRFEHPAFHHDMFRLTNGNTILVTWAQCDPKVAECVMGGMDKEEEKLQWSDPEHVSFFMAGLGVGGRPRDLTGFLSDAIVEITPKGSVVRRWNAWEHFMVDEDRCCAREFLHEWTHCNSVDWRDGKLLLSFREISRVAIVEWATGKLEWKWGRIHLSHQHDASFTPEGNVLVFDNGTHHPVVPHSRVVEVDPRTDRIVWQYQPRVVFSFFSGHIGGAERLENGNTLICEGQSGRVFEVTPPGDVCWEWINPMVMPFKNVHCQMLFRAHRYASTAPELEGLARDFHRYEELNRRWGLA